MNSINGQVLMKVEEESEKASLKLNMQKLKIVASSLITSWQIDRETTYSPSNPVAGSQPPRGE